MKRVKDEAGFTLVEVLVTILMMSMVVMALYSMFDMSLRVFSVGNSTVEANQNARVAVDRMEREIRSAWPSSDCASPTPANGQTLVSGNTTSISFRNCFANSGTPTPISYSVTNGWLTRNNGERVARVGNGGSLQLAYCTATPANPCPVNPTTSTDPAANTVLVQIRLTVRDGDRTQTLVTSAGLRNAS